MLANTLTITINAVARVLVRISESNGASVYQLKTATDLFKLQVRQSDEPSTVKSPQKIARSNMFFEHTVFATPTEVQKYYSMSAVMRLAESSDPAYLDYIVTGFNALLDAQSTSIIGGEV